MKILYLIDTHPQNGGAPVSSCHIAKETAIDGNDTAIIFPTQDIGYSLPDGVRPIIIKDFNRTFPSPIFNPFKHLMLAVKLKKVLEKERPNILHVQMPRGALAVGLLKFFKLIPSEIKFVYTDREQIGGYPWLLKLLCYFFIQLTFNAVVCLTDISSEYLKMRRGRADIVIIPNSAGRIYEVFNYRLKAEMRDRNGVPEDALVVMFAGRMIKDKNWSLAFEIIEKISQEGVFPFFIVSASDYTQKAEAKEFVSKVMQVTKGRYLGLMNIKPEEMADYYYIADIFVITSDKEAFGRTIIEAMSRQCVIIGRNVGGIPEVINKKENILPYSSYSFYRRIMEYRANRKELEEDKQLFYKRFQENYTTLANKEKHKRLYNQLLSIS